MKASIFNRVTDADGTIVANSLSGHIVKFENKEEQFAKEILANPVKTEENEKVFDYMKARGFLVDGSMDEVAISDRVLKSVKNNNGFIEFIILPTDDCNFRCPYCYEDHVETHMSKEFADKFIKFLDKNLWKYKGVLIQWFGGEPLMELDFVLDVCTRTKELCKKHKKQFVSGMTTNGFLLTKEVFLKLHKVNVVEYQITLDGLKETHDAQRPHVDPNVSSWEQIIQNLRDIKELKNVGMTRFALRTNFTRAMLPQAYAFADFLADLFEGDTRFGIFWRQVSDFGGERIHDMEEQLISAKELDEYKKYAAKKGLPFYVDRASFRPGGHTCYANKSTSYILGSDEIIRKSTCEYDEDYNKLGYFTEDGDMVINDKNLEFWTGGKTCNNKSCSFRLTCMGDGCPKTHQVNKSKVCAWYPNSVEDVMKLLCLNEKTYEKCEVLG